MDSLRIPFFVAALILLTIAVLLEIGSVGLIPGAAKNAANQYASPGLGIPYLALFDGILLYTVITMGLALVIPARILGRVQGIVSFIFFLLLLIGAIVLIFVALGLLLLMIGLVMAVPFGLIVYMPAFADFNVGGAQATLGVIMTLKIAFAVCLVLAQQRFLQMKGLITLILVSMLANVIVSFLVALPPSFLASITDAIAAIIVGILAVIWALISFVGSIPAIIKALRVDRALA